MDTVVLYRNEAVQSIHNFLEDGGSVICTNCLSSLAFDGGIDTTSKCRYDVECNVCGEVSYDTEEHEFVYKAQFLFVTEMNR